MDLLDPVEVRVLGALMEKEATTPEYYPLSLNALVNACNQKTNRHPVVNYDDDIVGDTLDRLRDKRLATVLVGSGRVSKYSQRISETLNLGRREMAVLCTLLLRGPQTLGEIKDRSERMFSFADLEEAESALEKLAQWPAGALARKLPRQPGQKEARYAHLMSGEPAVEAEAEAPVAQPSRVAQLEQELQVLKTEVAELRRRLDDLDAQLR
jgi:uncharacterized protein YceH (UPF0502 family)